MLSIARDITERVRADREIRRSEARLASLLRINQYPARDIQDLLDFALNEAILLTESRIGYIYLYDEDRGLFTLNTWSKEVLHQCTVLEKQTVYELDKTGIWGEAVRQRKPILVNEYAAPNPLKKGLPEGHAPLRRFLTVPVFDGDRIIAVAGVANKEAEYDESDIRQLTWMMDAIRELFPASPGIRVDRDIQDFERGVRHIFPLGTIVNELITNSMKHAFEGRDRGRLGIRVAREGDEVTLEVRDDGRGLPEGFDPESSPGFGLQLVRMLAEQLNGGFTIRGGGGTTGIVRFRT